MSGPSGVIDQGAGVLAQAAREVAAAQSDLDRVAHQLAARVEPMAASWRGAGGAAFFGFHQAWQEKEQRIVAILTGFAEAIDATRVTTTQVDAGESSSYRAIAGRLG
jgi:WXG100 family type VII secretion target